MSIDKSAASYNDPLGGQDSSIGEQLRTDYFYKKALIEAKKQQYFSQLASVREMPKHMGKRLVQYHYIPMLDDANINDQGIDANGVTTTRQVTIIISGNTAPNNIYTSKYAVGEGNSDAAARAVAEQKAVVILKEYFGAVSATYAAAKAEAIANGASVDDTNVGVPVQGNLYGSSKDVGTISSKMPVVGEHGGRVNRVGWSRVTLEGTFQKFGFFTEYTRDSLDFDTDSELMMHINREMIVGANEITEDLLQIDLLNSAGVVRYGGIAMSDEQITGEGVEPSIINYGDLMRLSIDLDNNRCPKHTTMITGTRMIDTKTIRNARFMYIGSELIPTIEKMTDHFGNPAFVSSEKYAAGTTLAEGEIGSVGQFRIIVVPEMMHWEAAGALEVDNTDNYRVGTNSDGETRYNIYPMLVVGDQSFTTIGWQTDGKSTKFVTYHKKPGKDMVDRNDPFGETGLSSLKFHYGFMALRPERIALCKTVAEL